MGLKEWFGGRKHAAEASERQKSRAELIAEQDARVISPEERQKMRNESMEEVDAQITALRARLANATSDAERAKWERLLAERERALRG